MKSLDNNLTRFQAFSSATNLIENRTVLVNENSKASISYVKRVFEEVVAQAESRLKNGVYYFFGEDLGNILEKTGHYFVGEEEEYQKDPVKNSIEEFKKYISTLTLLEENPKRLYSEDPRRANILARICEEMQGFYYGKMMEEATIVHGTDQD